MFIRLLIFFIVGVVIYRFAKSLMGGKASSQREVGGQEPMAVDDVMIQDPVCGAYFPKRKGVTLSKGGQVHQFCSERCRDLFEDTESESH